MAGLWTSMSFRLLCASPYVVRTFLCALCRVSSEEWERLLPERVMCQITIVP